MAKKRSDDEAEYSFAEEMSAGEVPTAEKLDELQESYKCYSTGSFMLDLAIGEKDADGQPGIPERSIVEIFGINSSLKSATSEHLMKSVLDADPKNIVVAIYAEEPDMDRLKGLGIDLKRVAAPFIGYGDEDRRTQMAEMHLDTAKRACQDPNVKLIVIDSLKALCSVRQLFDPKGQVKELQDNDPVAVRARLIGEFIRDFKNLNKRAILFMVNQTSDRIQTNPRDNVQNPMFNIQTPGGRAKEFECHLRIQCQTRPIESENEHPLTKRKLLMGWEVCYRLIKNKYSNKTANRVAISEFYFNPAGFKKSVEILNCGEYLGLIKKGGGAVYTIGDTKVRGFENALALLEKNPKLLEELAGQIVERSEEIFSLDEGGEGEKTSAQI